MTEEPEAFRADLAGRREVYLKLIDLLAYPQGPGGEVLVAHQFRALIAYHLALCDVRIGDTPVIRPRPITGPGMFPDAVEWVPAEATDAEIDAERARRRAAREADPSAAPSRRWRAVNRITVEPPDETGERGEPR